MAAIPQIQTSQNLRERTHIEGFCNKSRNGLILIVRIEFSPLGAIDVSNGYWLRNGDN